GPRPDRRPATRRHSTVPSFRSRCRRDGRPGAASAASTMTTVGRSLDGRVAGLRERVSFADAAQLLPTLLVFTIALIWAWDDGGFEETTWLPGAVFLVALLATILVATRITFGSRLLTLAVVSFGVFTAWNYLTILWAQEPGPAWTGANRTLLYFAVFTIV